MSSIGEVNDLSVLREKPDVENAANRYIRSLNGTAEMYDVPLPEGLQDSCNLCNVDFVEDESETDRWHDEENGHVVVEPLDKKGHDVRNMLVYGEHGPIEDLEDEISDAEPMRRLFEVSADQILDNPDIDNYSVLTVGLNSIPRHLHAMASNLEVDSDDPYYDDKSFDNDHILTNSYLLWDLEGGYEYGEPDEVMIRADDYVGQEVLKPLYESETGQELSETERILQSAS